MTRESIPEYERGPKGSIEATEASRVYFLPNVMTAGNLFCGFLAVIRCIQAKYAVAGPMVDESLAKARYTEAVWLILAAIIFDGLDGRVARLGGRESLFGKEFDSIADIVSFGMAPALLVFFLILSPTEAYPFFRQCGWLIGFVYLLCAAVRLARFNVITHPLILRDEQEGSGDFQGLPVPAAAGMIASLVLLLNRHDLRAWAIFLPILLLLIAFLMVSTVPYPSFKNIGWQTRTKFRTFICLLIGLVLLFQYPSIAVVGLFLSYIFFGLGRYLYRSRGTGPTSNGPSEPTETRSALETTE